MFNSNLVNLQKSNEDLEQLLEEYENIDYSAFYRGVVIDNKDPLGLGRVKVRIPQIHGVEQDIKKDLYVSSSNIAWATSGVMVGGGNDTGQFLIPNIGDIVFVTFEGGKPDLPIYFGGILTKRGNLKKVGSSDVNNDNDYFSDEDDLIKEVDSMAKRVIYKSLKGSTIYIDDTDGKEAIYITDSNGQSIIMENCSNTPLARRGDTLGKNGDSQIVITNNQGDSISLKHGRIHIKSKHVVIETDNLDEVGYNRDYTEEFIEALKILKEKSVTIINDLKEDYIVGFSNWEITNKEDTWYEAKHYAETCLGAGKKILIIPAIDYSNSDEENFYIDILERHDYNISYNYKGKFSNGNIELNISNILSENPVKSFNTIYLDIRNYNRNRVSDYIREHGTLDKPYIEVIPVDEEDKENVFYLYSPYAPVTYNYTSIGYDVITVGIDLLNKYKYCSEVDFSTYIEDSYNYVNVQPLNRTDFLNGFIRGQVGWKVSAQYYNEFPLQANKDYIINFNIPTYKPYSKQITLKPYNKECYDVINALQIEQIYLEDEEG